MNEEQETSIQQEFDQLCKRLAQPLGEESLPEVEAFWNALLTHYQQVKASSSRERLIQLHTHYCQILSRMNQVISFINRDSNLEQ